MCTVDTNIDNTCDINFKSSNSSNLLLNEDVDVIDESHKITPLLSPSPFKTTSKFWLIVIKNYYVQFKLKLYYVTYLYNFLRECCTACVGSVLYTRNKTNL